jgi:hypothetical protein
MDPNCGNHIPLQGEHKQFVIVLVPPRKKVIKRLINQRRVQLLEFHLIHLFFCPTRRFSGEKWNHSREKSSQVNYVGRWAKASCSFHLANIQPSSAQKRGN